MERVRTTYPRPGGVPGAVTCVPESEWAKWEKLATEDDAKAVAQSEDKRRTDEVRAISDAKVAQWPNTIKAQRQAKEKDNKDRMDREEQRRLVIDKEEADLMAFGHKSSQNRANLMLFERMDKVKAFTSRLVLAGVLEERAHQVEVAKVKDLLMVQDNKRWHERQEKDMAEYTVEEARKIEARKAQAIVFRQELRDQLEAVRQMKLSALRLDKAEGETLAAAATADEIRERMETEAKRIRGQHQLSELVKANEKHREEREVRANGLKEDEMRIEQYRVSQEALVAERARRMEEKHKEKLMRAQEMRDAQSNNTRLPPMR